MIEPAVGQIVDGRYQLDELIGRGGMGMVFRARHVFTHQQVAIKLITAGDLDADTMSRFLAEARVATTIGHPAIVEVSDANRTPDGQLYLVMELLVGKPLRLAMARPLGADDIKRIALELLDAIAAAHARGVVHRDLKPENI
jgi:serine/threonine-protein kinase